MRRTNIHEQYDVGTGGASGANGRLGKAGKAETSGSASRTGDYGTGETSGTGGILCKKTLLKSYSGYSIAFSKVFPKFFIKKYFYISLEFVQCVIN